MPTSYCEWDYLSLDNLPTGVSSSSVEALYRFDKKTVGLTDRTGNGHNLTLNGGNEIYVPTEASLGVAGHEWRSDRYAYGPAGLTPGTTGAFTVEAIITPAITTVEADTIFVVIGSTASGLEEDNCTVLIKAWRSSQRGRYICQHEYGAGQWETGTFSWAVPAGMTHLVALTRASDGKTYKLYVNGTYLETLVFTNAVTGGGGSNVRCRVAGYSTGTDYYGVTHSIRYVKGVEYTAAQVLEAYEACRVECGTDEFLRFRLSFDSNRRSGPRQQDGSLQSDVLSVPGVSGITTMDGGLLDT